MNLLNALLPVASPPVAQVAQLAASTHAAHQIGWWEGAAGAVVAGLIGALIGSLVPYFITRRSRAVERHGELAAMWAELYHAHRAMRHLRTDGIKAPLYRMPLSMFELAVPKLIGEGLLTDDQVSGLVEYLWRIEELNRGLDNAAAAAAAGPMHENLLQAEYGRNLLKAQEILEKKEPRRRGGVLLTVFEGAWEALFAAERATMTARIKRIATGGRLGPVIRERPE